VDFAIVLINSGQQHQRRSPCKYCYRTLVLLERFHFVRLASLPSAITYSQRYEAEIDGKESALKIITIVVEPPSNSQLKKGLSSGSRDAMTSFRSAHVESIF
jgi:hypothetical protein